MADTSRASKVVGTVRAERVRRPHGSRSQFTAPRALADSLCSMNGYVFNEKNSQSDREFRRFDARAMLKALRGLGFVVVPKAKRQP